MKKTKCIAVHVTDEVAEKMKVLAHQEGKPVSIIVGEMIESYCDDVGIPECSF